MCPYAKFNSDNPNQIPIYEYLQDFCTLCVLGNMKTLHEALESEDKKNGENTGH